MIICIISPIRFKDAIMEQYNELSSDGHIVLFPVVNAADDVTDEELMELHKKKIDWCDKVLVLNVGGYMGRGTYEEIGYAAVKGKPIEFLEEL